MKELMIFLSFLSIYCRNQELEALGACFSKGRGS